MKRKPTALKKYIVNEGLTHAELARRVEKIRKRPFSANYVSQFTGGKRGMTLPMAVSFFRACDGKVSMKALRYGI